MLIPFTAGVGIFALNLFNMPINRDAYLEVKQALGSKAVLVAVSKTKPVEEILALYSEGQRDFGENYVQELVDKQPQLPADIRWHFIGHLQSNKIKYIIPFVHLIQGVDSLKLLKEINKQAAKAGRVVDVLLQVFIAREETKFGLDAAELTEALTTVLSTPTDWANIRIRGLMGMASNSDDPKQVQTEFHALKQLFDANFGPATDASTAGAPNASQIPATSHTPDGTQTANGSDGLPSPGAPILSMGMSGDYQLAVAEGSTMVRVGSLLFGKRG